MVADDGLVLMVWCKYGFWRRRSHFDGKRLLLKRLWSKKTY